MPKYTYHAAVLLFALRTCCFGGDLTVNPLFSDHAILQQAATVPIWGTAKPGATVRASYRDAQSETTADPSGKWLVYLQTPKAESGKDDGYDLTVSSDDQGIVSHDVVTGEVWFGSGQSNIDTPLNSYRIGDEEIPKANIPGVRLCSSGFQGTSPAGFQWNRCTPEIAAKSSASGYFFCRELHKALNVPVGFVNAAVGGSALCSWVRPDWLVGDSRMASNFETFKTITVPALIAESLAKWQAASDEAKAKGIQPPPMPLSGEQPLDRFIGGNYVRRIAPLIPFVFKGMLWDQGESGVGMKLGGEYDLIFEIMITNLRRDFGYDFPVVFCQMPKGGGWGPTLRKNISKTTMSIPGDLVPLAEVPRQAPPAGRVFQGFGKESDPFARMMELPSCYMATTRDLVAALHPDDKDEYGARFCLTALNKVYGRNTEYFGPLMTSAHRSGGEIRVTFDHVGTGLAAVGGRPLQGFYCTDAKGKSSWTEGRIEGATVILDGKDIDAAQTVSYAHINGGRVLWANLFNREGLPAYPMTMRVE